MRAANRLIVMLVLAAAAACRNQPAPDQNIAIDNDAATPAEVETLPADESSVTPTNELVNGMIDPDVSDLNTANSD
jgi:hypothetical protein